MLPHTNATLTAAATNGRAVDLEDDDAAGTALWTGPERVLYRETLERVAGLASADLTSRRTIVVPAAVGAHVVVGATVTWTPDGGTERTDRVQLVERRDTPGMPLHIRSARLILDSA